MKAQLFIGISIVATALLVGTCISCKPLAEKSIRERELLAQKDLIYAEQKLSTETTDDYIRRLIAELDVYKGRARFDSDLAVQTFADHALELKALQIALVDTQEGLEMLNRDTRAAADNSWWTLILFPICIFISTIISAALTFSMVSDIKKNLRKSVREVIEQLLKEQKG